jgi:hypothetical protein
VPRGHAVVQQRLRLWLSPPVRKSSRARNEFAKALSASLVLELIVLGATLSVAAWVAGAGAARRTGAARALDRYAAARGLLYVPPPMPRASPKVSGTKDGIPYVFDLYRLNGEPRTRVLTDCPRGRAAVLSVGQRDGFHWQSAPVMQLGEERFDRAYLVLTGENEDGEVLREAQEPLLVLDELRKGVWLRSDGHKVSLSWRGLESDPVVLDAARDALVLIAARHRPGMPYR